LPARRVRSTESVGIDDRSLTTVFVAGFPIPILGRTLVRHVLRRVSLETKSIKKPALPPVLNASQCEMCLRKLYSYFNLIARRRDVSRQKDGG